MKILWKPIILILIITILQVGIFVFDTLVPQKAYYLNVLFQMYVAESSMTSCVQPVVPVFISLVHSILYLLTFGLDLWLNMLILFSLHIKQIKNESE